MNQMSDDPTLAGAAVPQLRHVAYFDGQRLAADDLNSAATVQREFRWLHNRSLHNWGIGLGFAVSGQQGDRQVTVAPGYAIDCLGREIVLTTSLTKAVPAKSAKTVCYLVAAYPDDSALIVTEQRTGDCGTAGAVRLQEQADIHWKIQGEQTVESGMEIVLAQATIENCQLSAPLSLDQRRSARSSQQPYIAAGETPLGATDWQLWTATDPQGTPPPSGVTTPPLVLGVMTTVDTAAARFGAIPEYQAQISGPRLLDFGNSFNLARVMAAGEGNLVLLDGTGGIDAPDRTSFLFYVLLPRGFLPYINPSALFDSDDGTAFLLEIIRSNWTVVWVGVEN